MKKHHGDQALIAELNTQGCRSKDRHPSKAHALAVGRRILREGGEYDRRVLAAYKCHVCGYWHLGNTRADQVRDVDAIARRHDDAPTRLERQLAEALRPYAE